MKKLFCAVIAGIIITLGVTVYSENIQSDIAHNIIRLHVIANSDSTEDQQLKLLVRDRILNEGREIFCQSTSPAESKRLLEHNLEALEKVARDEIRKQGYDYDVKLKTGDFDFPAKQYENITLPAGEYYALRIEIGRAEGKNWWCVMFPPLCFVDASVGVSDSESMKVLRENLSEESYELITQSTPSVEMRFKIVDFVQSSAKAIKTAFNK